jgi:hypothetical protein
MDAILGIDSAGLSPMSEPAGGDSNQFACCMGGLKADMKKKSGAQRHRF